MSSPLEYQILIASSAMLASSPKEKGWMFAVCTGTKLYFQNVSRLLRESIHLFYEVVPTSDDKDALDDGILHYCCFQGFTKFCTHKNNNEEQISLYVIIVFHLLTFGSLSQCSCNNLNPYSMNNLYRHRSRIVNDPTSDEIATSSLKKVLDGPNRGWALKILEIQRKISKNFWDQKTRAAVRNAILYDYILCIANRPWVWEQFRATSYWMIRHLWPPPHDVEKP